MTKMMIPSPMITSGNLILILSRSIIDLSKFMGPLQNIRGQFQLSIISIPKSPDISELRLLYIRWTGSILSSLFFGYGSYNTNKS